jgi:malate dehydrogenase (oxaloacetate-decarboxylating)
MDINERSEKLHKELRGKIGIEAKAEVKNKEDLSLVYTPGVAHVSSLIAEDKSKVYDYTSKANTIAIVSDGSAVLGLGNIGPEAALPVMEGKSLILKEFAGVNCVPLVLQSQDKEEIIATVKNISPTFGGIILEDFKAPECFEIEQRLSEELDIPVIHDDQHGIAIVVLAALINSLSLRDGEVKKDVRIVISGAGAAGVATAKLLSLYGFSDIVAVDSKGILSQDREDLNSTKLELLMCCTNKGEKHLSGGIDVAFAGADVFIGLSKGGTVSKEMVESMNHKPIIFALANPTPEIDPALAVEAGAFIVATGRSDYPNQLNNALVFPGLIQGALMWGLKKFDKELFIKVAESLAKHKPATRDAILPDIFDTELVDTISGVVRSYVGK